MKNMINGKNFISIFIFSMVSLLIGMLTGVFVERHRNPKMMPRYKDGYKEAIRDVKMKNPLEYDYKTEIHVDTTWRQNINEISIFKDKE